MDGDEPLDRSVFDREVYRPALGWRVMMGLMVALGVVSVVTLGAHAVMEPGPMSLVVVAGLFAVFLATDALSGSATLTADRVGVRTLLRARRISWEQCRGVRVVSPSPSRFRWADALFGGACGAIVVALVPTVRGPGLSAGIFYIMALSVFVSLRWAVCALIPPARGMLRPLSGITIVDTQGRTTHMFGALTAGEAVRLRARLRLLGIEQIDGPLP